MRGRSIIRTAFYVMFITLFVGLFVVGAVMAIRGVGAYSSMDSETLAWIIDYDTHVSSDDDGTEYTYNYTYEYEAEGVLYVRTSNYLVTKLNIGDKVSIRYRSVNPEDSRMELEYKSDKATLTVACIVLLVICTIAWLILWSAVCGRIRHQKQCSSRASKEKVKF